MNENTVNTADTTFATVESIRSQITELEGQLSTLAGEGLPIWSGRDGGIYFQDMPTGGATLTVEWAVSDHSYEDWYPTTEAAKAALLELARANFRAVNENGFEADLTAPGCHDSRAYVTRR